jgi:hypothetical protein
MYGAAKHRARPRETAHLCCANNSLQTHRVMRQWSTRTSWSSKTQQPAEEAREPQGHSDAEIKSQEKIGRTSTYTQLSVAKHVQVHCDEGEVQRYVYL